MLMLPDPSRHQCVRFVVILQKHVSDWSDRRLLGDDLESTLGSPPGVLEEQVCMVSIRFRPVNKNVWAALEWCCSWLCRNASRRRAACRLPRFQGIPSYHRPVGEYLGSLHIGSVRLTRVIYRSA